MKVALIGASGHMGSVLFDTLLKEDYIDEIRVLRFHKKETNKLIKKHQQFSVKITAIDGSIADEEAVKKLVDGVNYVLNLGAIIPPHSDHDPKGAIESNEIGPKVLCKVIESLGEKQPKLIHISTVALFGDRNENHLFGRIGDPLLVSVFDIYALTKMRGEFTVLESNVKQWTVLRQTAMLYEQLLMANISDGLMFHTCFNAPLEWVTAKDSAILIRNILRRDRAGELNEENFWKHCFNIGGGPKGRATGSETFDLGFKMIGASTKQFFDPNYNAIRNFHGVFYSDSNQLEELFHFQEDSIAGFWDDVLSRHKYFKMGKIVPKKLLKQIIIKKLLRNDNAPRYWYKHQDEARMLATFKGSKAYEAIPKKWDNFYLLSDGKDSHGHDIDYEQLKNNVTYVKNPVDLDKPRQDLSIKDLENYASYRGGKLLSKDYKNGEIYKKLKWVNHDGVEFIASAHTVVYCGHWHNVSYEKYAWDFDRQAKFDKLVAEVWYDAHDKDEDRYYWYDEEYKAHYRQLEK